MLNTDFIVGMLGKDGLAKLVAGLVSKIGLTDILGYAATYARGIYEARGREAVVRLATIKEASLTTWAKTTGADPAELVAAGRDLAEAFATFVGTFLPKAKR